MQRSAPIHVSSVDLSLFILDRFESTLKQVEGVDCVAVGYAVEEQVVSWVVRKEDLVHWVTRGVVTICN